MNVLDILEWLKKAMRDRVGSILVSFLLGMTIPSAICYFFSLELRAYEDKIIDLKGENDELLSELREWQKRAFRSDSLCIEKMKNMASFFKGLKEGYQGQINTTRAAIKNTDNSIKEQGIVKKELNKLKKKVSAYE